MIENLPNEEWRDIIGYEGLYQVSNKGRVKSLNRIIEYKNGKLKPIKEKILKQINNDGYCVISLSKGNKVKNHLVHRLVAEAFIPNPHNLPYVNHKSEVRNDNFVENLEWCTPIYNFFYGTARERSRRGREKPIYQIDLNTSEIIQEWNSATEASKTLDIPKGCICNCCKNNVKSAGGYMWSYTNNYNEIKYVNKHYTPIIQIDLDGNIIKEWDKLLEAAKELNLSESTIRRRCIFNKENNSNLSYKGYVWKYKNVS